MLLTLQHDALHEVSRRVFSETKQLSCMEILPQFNLCALGTYKGTVELLSLSSGNYLRSFPEDQKLMDEQLRTLHRPIPLHPSAAVPHSIKLMCHNNMYLLFVGLRDGTILRYECNTGAYVTYKILISIVVDRKFKLAMQRRLGRSQVALIEAGAEMLALTGRSHHSLLRVARSSLDHNAHQKQANATVPALLTS